MAAVGNVVVTVDAIIIIGFGCEIGKFNIFKSHYTPVVEKREEWTSQQRKYSFMQWASEKKKADGRKQEKINQEMGRKRTENGGKRLQRVLLYIR